jgi:hypothetical protein
MFSLRQIPVHLQFLALIFIAIAMTNCATTNKVRIRHDVFLLEHRRIEALIAADTTTLAHYLADDLRYVHTNGVKEDKAEFLQAIASGKYRFTAYETDSLQWRYSKSLVIVYGSAHILVRAFEKDLDIRTKYTAVYTLNRRKKWQLASWQNTRI